MTCNEFWISVSPPAAGKEFVCGAGRPMVPDSEESDHLRHCPACAAELARHARLADELALAAVELRRVQAPARVEARLAAAFRWQTAMPPAPRRPWLAPVLWWAAAAALLVCAGLFLWGGRQPMPQRHPRPAAVEWAELTPAPVVDADESFSTEDNGFIPLPGAERSAWSDEQVDLVRVEVPRSAMIAFGIPVNPEDAADSVEADVLMGPDGLARAVRFVN